MPRVDRRSTCLALALLGSSLLTQPACSAEVVNIYNARHYGTDEGLWKSLTERTGIEVNVVSGSDEELLQRLLAEGASSPADLLITVDAGRLAFAVEQGLLQPVRSAALEATIPAHLRDPDGRWFGLAMRARVIMYAKDRVDPAELSTYEALADPRWKGRLLIRSSSSVYNLSLIGSLIAADGPDATEAWCEGVVTNLARPPQGGDTDQIKAVAAGVGDLVVSNSYYLARLGISEKAEERAIYDDIGVFFPNQGDRGAHVNITGAGVLAAAPHRDNALMALEFLASPEAQRYFADVGMEYPVNAEVRPHPVLAEWGELKQDTLNAAVYARNSAEAARIADRCGWK